MPRRALLACLAALALALPACGENGGGSSADRGGSTATKGAPAEPDAGTTPPTLPSSPRPDDPAEALAWVRAARTMDDPQELRRRLARWPVDAPDFLDTEETQIVLTWRIRMALQDGSIERAVDQWKLLLQHYEGHGVSPEGRGLTPEMIRLGLIDDARLLARRRAEGPKPNALGAESAWKHGADLLTPHDVEDADRLERARRWALWDTFDRWCAEVGAKPGPALGDPDTPSPDARPFVVVVSDDFALGEAVFQGVLARWMRDGKDAGLVGVLVPVRRGEVRRGMRRVAAADPREETAAFEEDAAKAGLVTTWTTASGLFAARFDEGAALAEAMGLERQETALLVVDRRGRIVARLSGTGLDPRVLDPVIQKVTGR